MMTLNICRQAITFVLIVCLTTTSPGATVGQTPSTDTDLPPGGDPWPRHITAPGATILVYQPQLDRWTGNQLEAYAAVAIQMEGSNDKAYGAIWFTARTEVDKVNRLVTLYAFKLTKRSFPSLTNNGSQYEPAFEANMPSLRTIPLDLLETSVATTSAAGEQKTYQLKNEPPNIIFSSRPAVLALIDGQPALRPAGDNLQKVINTRALIIFDPSKQLFYLALMNGWAEAPAIGGPWSLARHAPTRSLDKLRQTAEASDQNQVLGNPDQSLTQSYEDGEAPTVYVSTVPAELLLTQGQPEFTPIPERLSFTLRIQATTFSWITTTRCFMFWLQDAGSGPIPYRAAPGHMCRAPICHLISRRFLLTAPKPASWFQYRARRKRRKP